MCGLVSPVRRKPMRKRTRLMTNSLEVVRQFRGLLCDRSHEHQVVEGTEGGVRLSTHAQIYPPGMLARLAAAAAELMGQ
eukprot:2758281-Pyramimonas_sp.AAC.1